VASRTLVHRDLDLVDRLLAPTAERDDLDGRRRLGSFTLSETLSGVSNVGIDSLLVAVVAARRRATDADSGGARALRAHAIARVEEDGIVERE
jgi:hypothetical protein